MSFEMAKFVFKIIVLCCVVVPSYSQRPPSSDCDKYCFKDCKQYLKNGSPQILLSSVGFLYFQTTGDTTEYSACVKAKVGCHCATRFSIRNPLLWITLAGIGIAISILIYYICRRYRMYHTSCCPSLKSERINAPEARNTQSSPPFSDWYTGNDYEMKDIPPDYVPPPSYYDIRKDSRASFSPNPFALANPKYLLEGEVGSSTPASPLVSLWTIAKDFRSVKATAYRWK